MKTEGTIKWNVILWNQDGDRFVFPKEGNPESSGRYLCTCVRKNAEGEFEKYPQFMEYDKKHNYWHDPGYPNGISHAILAWAETVPLCDDNNFKYEHGCCLVKNVVFLDALGKETPLIDGNIYISVHRYARIDGIDYDLLEDHNAVRMLLENGIISYSVETKRGNGPYGLFATYIMSQEKVSYAVLDMLWEYGKVNFDMNAGSLMGLVSTPWILEWFLKKGFKCHAVNGTSTMGDILYGIGGKENSNFYEMARLLKKYEAWDPVYVGSLPDGDKVKKIFQE